MPSWPIGAFRLHNGWQMPQRIFDRRGRLAWVLAAVLVVVTAGLLAGWGAWQALQRTGRSPAELLDYADQRMEGHPKVEWLAAPMMSALRTAFKAAPLQQRMALPFEVPPPPPRRGAAEISPPEPVPPGATVWRVGPSGPLTLISEAARLAKDGDVVEIEAGDYHGDVASWHQRRLSIRGVNGAARIYAAGRSAEGKAIWVFKQGDFDIANIDFVGARAADQNGAGIRLERGQLRIRSCLFWDNQMGLVTADVPYAINTSLEIEASEFAYSHVSGRWGHNLYVGAIDRLRVTGSYFHHASNGHLLKTRAAVNEILYNRLTDETGGRASYEANFPNGGKVLMLGNIVQQQQATENGIIISYGEEGYRWPTNELTLVNNTLVNDLTPGGAFVRVAPGPVSIVFGNNLLVGTGVFLIQAPFKAENDSRAEWQDLVRPSRQDYRIRSNDARFARRVVPGGPSAPAPVPTFQYIHPRQTRPLSEPPRLVGAEQRAPD